MQKWMMAGLALVMCATGANAQRDGYRERAMAYVEKYKMFAMAEQQRTGVPAAITLGQGILETEAGNSVLATEANNHFGIKCKSTWRGETYSHTDDAPNECFRKYTSTYESYKDHSDFLKQPRYKPLFNYAVTDYDNWAKGLKRFGYATNPRYAQQLVKIIEDFNLQDYTFAATNKDIIYPGEVVPNADAKPATGVAVKEQKKPEPKIVAANTKGDRSNGSTKASTPKAVTTTPVTTPPPPAATESEMQTIAEIAATKETIAAGAEPGKITRINGLRAVYGLKGDVLLTYAIKYDVRYERLLEINEVPDAPLSHNMYVFLDKKKTKGAKPMHVMGKNETLLQAAQTEGIQLKALMELNRLEEGEVPLPGETLYLQRTSSEKPQVVAKATTLPGGDKGNGKTAKKQTYLEKKELEKAKREEEEKAMALKAQQEEEAKVAALKAQQEEEEKKLAALQAQQEEEAKQAALKAEEEAKTAALKAQQEEEARLAALKAEEEAKLAALKAEEEARAKQGNRVVIKENEPQDEFSRLKSQLDKVVYAGDEKKEEDARKAEEEAKKQEEQKRLASVKAAEDSRYYTVKKGDTAAGIARKNKLTMRQLMEWNNMDWAEVTPGQKLIVKQ